MYQSNNYLAIIIENWEIKMNHCVKIIFAYDRMKTRSKRQAYRSHLKTSKCRGKSSKQCRRMTTCKRTRVGQRRSYCRRRRNRHI